MFQRQLSLLAAGGALALCVAVAAGQTRPGGEVRGDPARLARIRGTSMPAIDRPVQFHTPEADAVLAALEVFPPDNPWNLVVEDWPSHPNSQAMIDSIGGEKPLR